MIPPDTTTTTTTSSTSLADQERDKCKNYKFKRGITVIKISKHIKQWREKEIKIRRAHEDDQDLAALYYKMKPP
jgi:hypothetical protein